ncbi:MAG: DDE-type integrase/transposase/recombinase, partial [Acidobacteriota bacterium]
MNLMQGVEELIPHFGIKASCSQLNVPRASYNRWRLDRNSAPAARRNVRVRPSRALDDSEIKQVEETLNSERFADQSPRAVYAALLDEEKYLCSWRTMYRIMGRNRQVRERRNQLRHPSYEKPQLVATGPNQLWSWDITRLMGPSKGVYYQLYVLIDVYSRYITGWMIADRESADLATRFIEESCTKQRINPGQLTVHADRGSSMMSKPLALLMEDLGITKSHSRPRVSNDNP